MRIIFFNLTLLILTALSAFAQSSKSQGHSHNDYHQNIPLLTAYYAGMASIEADVFIKDGELYVAHEAREIKAGRTLKQLYLSPLATFYKENKAHAYKDSLKKLQLVVDIKEDHVNVLKKLISELETFGNIFDFSSNPNAIKIVVSGNMPQPTDFKNWPDYIFFDGRPETNYTESQLKRVAMISQDIKKYSVWNGKGVPTPTDYAKLKKVIDDAHKAGKPFRFWATPDSQNTWIVLERLGADWINTDKPTDLADFYLHQDKLTYTNPRPHPVYTPEYRVDGQPKKVKNVILLIGDGMGLAQIHAGLIANHGDLNISRIRNIGFSQTAAANSGNTDSAAGATAMATGEKTNNRYIGVGTDGKKRTNLVDILAGFGVKSGIISVGDITDATPASFYAHQIERSMNNEIAADLLHSKAEILVGSNRNAFIGNKDAQLMQKLKANGFNLNENLVNFSKQTSGKQLVLLSNEDVKPVIKGRGNILKQSLLKTIQLLSKNKKGFFIMAEGAQIDHGGHSNDLPILVTEMHDFDKTIEAALRFADKDGETLVIITADHETGGLSLLDADASRGKVTAHFSTDDHTNIMVPVFAYGPQSDKFRGVYPNNEIFKKILRVLSHNKAQ
ncbi:alkaline phosphatase [Pedobacter aquatilis]|uniref:alkaline phosphatase n=1 Tax=Pedobacter aquatilis TaxID=351343 RepID=UPI0025B30423|nr:alkaline phosphatase [Pedobacter aquatilis]MDN3588177.1 alkaline phosphatase [Pedobacter aquatilis]